MNMVILSLQETWQEPHDCKNRSATATTTTADRIQFNGLFSLLPMREKSKVKEYIPGDFEKLSDEERDMWLADQCSLFEEEIKIFYDEKENYVEELFKRLRKVTRRWTSWNHRSFGPVVSREQVKELLQWERQNQSKITSNQTSGSSGNQSSTEGGNSDNYNNITPQVSTDPLERFESYCDNSAKLLHIFRQDIYRPLCDFFSDDDSDTVIKEIPKHLEKCVQKWEALLQFSPVNEKLFNRYSEKLITSSLRTNRISESDTVLRLVPDLYQKKLEVLRLATKWRLIANSKIIQRRGTYTLSPKTLDKRETMTRARALAVSQEVVKENRKCYDNINEELMKTRRYYVETNKQLKDTQDKCERVENEMESCKVECERLRDQLRQTAELRKCIEMKVYDSYMSHGSNSSASEENNNKEPHDVLWEKELERIKTKYSHQKVKFLNSRKQIETLNKQLEFSQDRCSQLQNNLDTTSKRFSSLEEQLEVARKNIQTQGNMVDALQHQCYTLKQELDTSNIKKGELYTQLSDTLERYRSVEIDLKQTKIKFKEIVDENGRRKSREEELERENTQLRKLIELQNTRRRSNESFLPPATPVDYVTRHRYSLPGSAKETRPRSPNKSKDCIFPDINGGRSF